MAARASLAFLGQEDVVLSSKPEVTYFVEKYTGQTPFSSRVDEVQFQADVQTFGSESWTTLPRSGDLVTNLYLKINAPLPLNTPVLNSAGTLMFKYADLYIGAQLVERLWGEYVEMKYDLEIPASKQGALKALTGKGTILARAGYTIPLPFSCIEKGLPLFNIKEDVTIRVIWRPTSFFTFPVINSTVSFDSTLHVEYTYLSDKEIAVLKTVTQPRIFEQVQRAQFFVRQGVNSVVCPLQFVNPVRELFLVIQNDTATGYDYSNVSGGSTSQLQDLTLFFNSTERISPDVGTPLFLRNLQALEFHTRIPDRLFYMYSFSIDPESATPSGQINFSRIPIQNLKLNLTPSTANRYIRVWAVSYNFLDKDFRVLFNNFEFT